MRTTAERKSQNVDAAYRLKAWWWYRQRVRVPRGLVPKSEWPRASHGVAVLRQLVHDVHLSRSAACSKLRASSEMLLLPGVFICSDVPTRAHLVAEPSQFNTCGNSAGFTKCSNRLKSPDFI